MRSINIRVLKEDKNYVTIKLTSANSKMRVSKKEYEKRLENGLYALVK
jgi:hypothetical protein